VSTLKENPAFSLGFSLWRLSNRWQQKATQALKNIHLTHVQFVLLAGIKSLQEQADNIINQKTLAQYVKTDIMMTSKVCRTLERKGLVIRAKLRSDTRSKMLVLTRKGKELLQKATHVMSEVEKDLFNKIEIKKDGILNMLYFVLEEEKVEPSSNVENVSEKEAILEN